jgi:hypothetical protein
MLRPRPCIIPRIARVQYPGCVCWTYYSAFVPYQLGGKVKIDCMSIPESEKALQDLPGQTDTIFISARLENWIVLLHARYRWAIRPLAIAAAIRILVFAIGLVGARFFVRGPFPGFFAIWLRKDAGWYTAIASRGYFYERGLPLSANFFPLYPLSVGIVQHVTGLFFNRDSYLVAGMAVSWVAFLAACVLLFRLVADHFGDQTAYLSVLLLAVFPFSYFFGAAYTESLYLLCVLLAFTGIERCNWWLAAIGAMLAGATHATGLIVGLAVVVAYVVDWIRTRHRLRWDLLALALTPLGAAAYVVYCWIHFGTPFAYFIAGTAGWGADTQFSGIRGMASTLIHPHLWLIGSPNVPLYLIYTLLILAFLAACYPVYRLLGASYVVYSLLSILATMIYHPGLNSDGRYLSVIFPVFIVLAYLLRDKPLLREITIISFTLLLATAVTGFTAGYGFS